jgi:acyl-CoA thioesterase-1|tara:strand:+ start:61 stop:684 length:624 start_codon:yes stop_codon:yes gene_type:complete
MTKQIKIIITVLLFSNPLIVFASQDSRTLLIYGDSISAGYGMEPDKQWAENLKVIFNEKNFDIEIVNRSVSGETTGGGLSRIKPILEKLQPKYLLLELGGNDALRGYPPSRILNNLEAIIEIAKGNQVKVFLMQIKILPNYGKRYQEQFESIFPRVAKENDIILLPFMLNDIALDKALMLPDGIHPNADAQPLIAEYVFKSLEPHLQ